MVHRTGGQPPIEDRGTTVGVDYTTYVFVPASPRAVSGLLPSGAGLIAAAVIVRTGAIYFADTEMKLPGNYFRGFPGLWNLATFYLFLLRPDPWIGVLFVVVLVGLTFAPFRFIHPTRVRRWRTLNVALVALWSFLALVAVVRDLDPSAWVTAGLVVIGLYFFAFGLLSPPEPTDFDNA
jgi:phosphatidylcholine synthase